jgi:hypothetical protein
MGLFDRLQNQLEDSGKDGGISPLDLASLPPRLRKIMRMMLREVEMTHTQLRDATAKMDEIDRLSDKELKEALDSLTSQSWLVKLGQDDLITYKVNLRRKGPSSLASGIWATLDDKLSHDKKDTDNPDSPAEQPPDTNQE